MGLRKPFVYNQYIEDIAKQARAVNNPRDLEDICLKMNIADEIFLGKVDLWLGKYALSTLYKSLKVFPKMREEINYFGTLQGFAALKDLVFKKYNPGLYEGIYSAMKASTDQLAVECRKMCEQNALAIAFNSDVSNFHFKGIIINGKSFSQKSIMNDAKMSEITGFHPIGCSTVKSIIDHEIGHLFDFVLNISSSSEYRQFISQYTVSQISKELAKYPVMEGKIDHYEVVAEAYSEFCNNKKSRKIANFIGLLIIKKYNEHFNNN